jgi:hypothetical protein
MAALCCVALWLAGGPAVAKDATASIVIRAGKNDSPNHALARQFAEAVAVADQAGVESVAQSIAERASGPRLYVMKVMADNLPRSLPPRDGVHLKNRLRTHLGFVVA